MKMSALVIALVLNVTPAVARSATQVIDVKVTEKGFEPSTIEAKPGSSVTLKIMRTTNLTCATQIRIQSANIKMDLPLNKSVTINLGKLDKGEIRFGCGMDMITGHLIVR